VQDINISTLKDLKNVIYVFQNPIDSLPMALSANIIKQPTQGVIGA
jgi:hypothetical protein